jgi:hypothetical protein
MVIGPSGSGKSSLVYAGLLPALEQSRYFKAGYWLIRTMRPGPRPSEVLEVIRAEGDSPWYTCAHDEFALSMDGEVDIHLIKLDAGQSVQDENQEGAILVAGDPQGKKMGWMKLGRGHQGMLPAGSAYQFRSSKPAVLILQTCKGELSIERWADICQTA